MSDGTTFTISVGLLITLAGIIYGFAVKYATKDDVKERERYVREDMAELSARCDKLEDSVHVMDKTHGVLAEQLKSLTHAVNKLDKTLDALHKHILQKVVGE